MNEYNSFHCVNFENLKKITQMLCENNISIKKLKIFVEIKKILYLKNMYLFIYILY